MCLIKINDYHKSSIINPLSAVLNQTPLFGSGLYKGLDSLRAQVLGGLSKVNPIPASLKGKAESFLQNGVELAVQVGVGRVMTYLPQTLCHGLSLALILTARKRMEEGERSRVQTGVCIIFTVLVIKKLIALGLNRAQVDLKCINKKVLKIGLSAFKYMECLSGYINMLFFEYFGYKAVGTKMTPKEHIRDTNHGYGLAQLVTVSIGLLGIRRSTNTRRLIVVANVTGYYAPTINTGLRCSSIVIRRYASSAFSVLKRFASWSLRVRLVVGHSRPPQGAKGHTS